MAIIVYTSMPAQLLGSIKKDIDSGHIVTWEYDSDGDFTHKTSDEQWYKKAWLRPSSQQGALLFGLLGQKGVKMSKQIYGVYHGRFIEMLLTHFDNAFTNVSATAQAGTVDSFK